MKTPSSRRAHGFTLVELLVVIAIIAVLAAAGFAAGNAAIQKAKRVTCQATATAIESAVNNFFTEYGSMPTKSTSGDSDGSPIDTSTDKAELDILLGFDTTVNGRGVKFLNVKQSKNKAADPKPKDGLVYNSDNSAKGLYDPWGGGFKVLMDLNFDEKVEPDTAASSKVTLYGRRVAVWSDGADQDAKNQASDDVKTW